LLIDEVEKAATNRWKKAVRTVKAIMYGILVVRIIIALYIKVHEDSDFYGCKKKSIV
jgi:hypothetical protein